MYKKVLLLVLFVFISVYSTSSYVIADTEIREGYDDPFGFAENDPGVLRKTYLYLFDYDTGVLKESVRTDTSSPPTRIGTARDWRRAVVCKMRLDTPHSGDIANVQEGSIGGITLERRAPAGTSRPICEVWKPEERILPFPDKSIDQRERQYKINQWWKFIEQKGREIDEEGAAAGRVQTDLRSLLDRAYCLSALGPSAVPYAKYKLNNFGKVEYVSSTCISNTNTVGDPDKGLSLTCSKGIKEVSMNNGYQCKACIEKYDQIGRDNPNLTQQNIPGVECGIQDGVAASSAPPPQAPDTPNTGYQSNWSETDLDLGSGYASYDRSNRPDYSNLWTPTDLDLGSGIRPSRPVPRPNDLTSGNTSADTQGGGNGQPTSTGGGNNTGTGGGGSQQQPPPPQYRPPSGPQGVQYLPPQQPQPQRQSLWQSIKQSLGGIGGRSPGGQDPRRVMPECPVFLAVDEQIERGQSTVLQWSLEYTSSAYITPGIGLVNPTQGSVRIAPEETTTYTIQTHNRNGYGKCAPVQVTVTEPADVDPGDGDQAEDTPKDPLMECSPSKVRTGGTGAVLWQCPSGVASSTGGSTEYPAFTTSGKVGGSVELPNMQESGKFVVRCMSDAGEEIGRSSCDIEVADNIYDGTPTDDGQPKANIAADKTEVNSGDIVTIAWRGDNVDGCMVSGPDGFKKYGTRGSITGRMLQTSTFALSCIANNVILPTKEITITVN